VFRSLQAGRSRWGASLLNGLRRLPYAAATSVLVLTTLFGPLLLATQLVTPVFLPLGLLFLLYVAVVASGTYLAIQVAVVEGGLPLRAMARSFALTRGFRWRMFGLVFLLHVAPAVVDLLVREGGPIGGPRHETLSVRLTVVSVLRVVATCLQAVVAAVAYHALRARKEGVELGELLTVFE
jgi:hypothetical protein